MKRHKINAVANSNFVSVTGIFDKTPSVRLAKWPGFGPGSLQLNGKIFALLSAKGRLVVWLSKERAQELVVSNGAEYFEPNGICMKEMVMIPVGKISWAEAAREAYEYVSEL